jgi:G:T-mismatch repair DNA endonuclease (very short patch repair protein)
MDQHHPFYRNLKHSDVYARTKIKEKRLTDCGLEVITKWGCELREELEQNHGMAQFFHCPSRWFNLLDPIRSCREAYYG